MRIQNNITAMNTHRMYTNNNDAVAASAKKLSSGYRINSAADDAAGLAISEKMRSQIRGLKMATKNSQDAISLVQTAEGALQETQNMLQRMNELAVQAATGTNEDLDRTALSKEFEQLKREINDVAEQTNFNNMKILDGSLSYAGFQRSAATAGVNNTVSVETNKINSALTQTDFAAGKEYIAVANNTPTFTPAAKTDTVSGIAGGDTLQVQITLKDGTTLVTDGTFKVDGTADPASWENITKNLSATSLKYAGTNTAAGVKITGDDSDGSLKIQADTTAPDRVLDFSEAKISFVKHEDPAGNEDGRVIDTGKQMPTNNTSTINAAINGKVSSATYEIDTNKIQYGDAFTVAGNTYEIVSDASKVTNGNKAVVWDGKNPDDIAGLLAAKINADHTGAAAGNITAAATGDKTITITSKQSVTAAMTAGDAAKNDAAVQMTMVGAENADKGKTNTIEFDIAKMKDGDTFTIKTSLGNFDVTYRDTMDRQGFMDAVRDAAKAADGTAIGEVKGNALFIKDATVSDITLKSGNLPDTNAVRIQVGALENEQLAVSIDSMNTAGLKLDDAFLSKVGNSDNQNIDLAGKAITATRAAINTVSDQRATLGAMQNRLEHKIANLKTTTENLSASESRIRDVDMAEEMTNFTKNNILSQAATAMLAQANSLPQNVLSLLG